MQFEHNKQSIATGRWGCGAFNGISQLKFLIQWIAASECDKDIIFYRREDKLLHNLEKIVNGLKKKNVGEILEIIKKFNLSDEIDLFEFIIKLY